MTVRAPRQAVFALAVSGLFALGMLGMGFACIIPDRDIQVRTTDFNLYPVRFVEGITLTEEALCDCSPSCACPLPDLTGLPAFLDPNLPKFQFCICGENKIDEGALQGVYLSVEDQDEVDGEPADLLYAAALLDWNPTLGVPPTDYVAYRDYLDPGEDLSISVSSSYENDVIKRPRPYVRKIELELNAKFDLCNDAGRTLEPGFHTLSLIVTDREWSKRITDEGMEVTNDGVPDIAAGATYDLQTYTFQCLAEPDCVCAEPTEP
jgi:hypothetical protein